MKIHILVKLMMCSHGTFTKAHHAATVYCLSNAKLKELNKCSIRSGNLFSVQYLHQMMHHTHTRNVCALPEIHSTVQVNFLFVY